MSKKIILLLFILRFLWAGGIKEISKRMGFFYRVGNFEAFQEEKKNLLKILEYRGRKHTRWPSHFILEEASFREDLNTLYFLYSLDPDNYKVSMNISRILLKRGKFLQSISFMNKAAFSYLSTPEGLYYSVYFICKVLLFSFIVFLFFISLGMLFKYSPLLYHDVSEALERKIPVIVSFLALLSLPLVIFPGWAYIFFFIPGLFILYLEENPSRFFIAVLVVITIFASLSPKSGKGKFAPAYRIMKTLYFYDEDSDTLSKAETYLRKNWDDDLAYFLGYSYERLGNLRRAVDLYEKILKHNPGHVETLVALAKIRYMSQEYPISLSLLKKALNRRGGIIPLYNLAFLLESIGNIAEAGKYTSLGWKKYGNRWGEIRGSSSDFLEFGWDKRDVFWKAYGLGKGKSNLPPVWLAIYYPFKNPSFLSPFIPGFLVFLFALLLIGKLPPNIGSARYCQGCGKTICERCSEYYYKGYCEDCMNMLQLTKGDMSSSMSVVIVKKKRKVEFFTEKIPRFLGFLFPGTYIFAEGKFKGWFLPYLYAFFLSGGIIGLFVKLPYCIHLVLIGGLFYIIALFYMETSLWRR